MSLRIRQDIQLKQSPFSGLKLKCYTCLCLDRKLRPLDAQNKYLLAMLCPKMFPRAMADIQYLICWECELMIVKIKRFQARLIKACAMLEGVTTTAEGLSSLKLTGIEIIDIPPQTVSTNESILKEILIAPLKLDKETTEIKMEREERGDGDGMISPSVIQQVSSDESTDTASEEDMLMTEDPLLIPIEKNTKEQEEIEVPSQKAVKNPIIAPNVKGNCRPEEVFINEPKKLTQANLVSNKESVPSSGKGKESAPIAVKDKANVPFLFNEKRTLLDLLKSKGSIPNVRKGEQSIPIIKEGEGSIPTLSQREESIVITQSVPSNPNPPVEPVGSDSEKRLGFYGCYEDEVKRKILNETELHTYREKRASGIIFKRSQYKCERCIKTFKFKENLDEHNKKHDESQGSSICDVCEQRFSDENVRNEHYMRHFIIFECLKCQHQNNDRMQIYEHIRQKHEVSSFYCRKCNSVFKTYKEMRKHKVKVHSKRLSCKECNKTFTPYVLNLHMTNTHRKETAECPICKKKVRKNYLDSHIKKTHNDTFQRENSAYCVECQKTFKNQHCYKRHLKTSLKHNTVEQLGIKCDHCNKYFPSNRSLNDHVEKINGVKYKCDICNKEIRNKKSLADHIRLIHKGQKPQIKLKICEYCGKSFSVKKILEQHINKHLGHRPYVCKDCGATFTYEGALFTHRRLVHKVKRRYEMTS